MATEVPPVCPRCGQLDAVRKVSSIVKEGISVGSYETYMPGNLGGKTIGIPVTKEAVSITMLAQQLQPPSREKIMENSPLGLDTLVIVVAGFGSIIGLMLLFIFLNDVGVISGFLTFLLIASSIITGPLLVGFLYRMSPRYRKEQELIENKLRSALNRWSQLHYCYRCDGVFIPGENRFVPIGQVQSFLYE
jgi:hypothetical protein